MADLLPGTVLKKICCVVVLVCAVHLSVTLVYYVSGVEQQNRIFHIFFPSQTTTANGLVTGSTDRSGTPPTQTQIQTLPVLKVQHDVLELKEEEKTTVEGKKMEEEGGSKEAALPSCPETPPVLAGPLKIEFTQSFTLGEIKEMNPNIRPGGRFTPKDCKALQKVAIIIPFRKRDEHLKYFLYYMHPILQRQQLDYGVYVINQAGDQTFNRAKLLNVGYVEAVKDYDYDCFVFSDVDLIPLDDRNLYRCFSQPRHLTVSMDKFGFRLPYTQFFGGAASLSKEQYNKINGFPNNYWGWGGEDDDIYNRIVIKGMSVSRPDGLIGRCRMIRHNRDDKNDDNPQRFDRLARTRQTVDTDGLNSLTYEVVKTEKFDLYTQITVDIGSPAR